MKLYLKTFASDFFSPLIYYVPSLSCPTLYPSSLSLLPQFLVASVHRIFPMFRFQWLADEVRRNLPIELDFRNEANNQERFNHTYKHLTFARVSIVCARGCGSYHLALPRPRRCTGT